MAYAPFSRFVMGGTTDPGTGVQEEIWACTISVLNFDGGVGPILDPETYLQEVKTPIATWFASGAAKNSNKSLLTYIKCNAISADGTYTDPSHSFRYDYPSPAVGTAAPNAPGIISVCMSWTTDKTRGPGSKGRIFPPNSAAASVGTLLIGGTVQTNLVLSAKELLNAVANSTGTQPGVPVVASNVNATNTPITGVRVGNVCDVQRRRKNELTETYAADIWP